MSRLASVVAWDARLQFRNGFYFAAGFVAVCSMVALSFFSRETLAYLLPPLILSNLLVNTFFFVGGLVLLEKAQGTLAAQVVTPLRSHEYLWAKIATLTVLAVAENLLIVIVAYGWDFGVVPFVAGAVLTSVIYVLLGFAVVVRYDSINEYLLPASLLTLLLSIPFIPYFGLGETWLYYLHPLQGPLLLLEAAFASIRPWEWLYALLYAAVWIVALLGLGIRAFHRFAIRETVDLQ